MAFLNLLSKLDRSVPTRGRLLRSHKTLWPGRPPTYSCRSFGAVGLIKIGVLEASLRWRLLRLLGLGRDQGCLSSSDRFPPLCTSLPASNKFPYNGNPLHIPTDLNKICFSIIADAACNVKSNQYQCRPRFLLHLRSNQYVHRTWEVFRRHNYWLHAPVCT